MAESLDSFKSYIGKSETANDVVTASTIIKFAATLGLENPPLEKGAAIPPGWYGGLFPASHRPDKMRTDGQASGGGIVPPIPLPRRRIGGTRVAFHEPLRIGDDVTRKTEIADLQIDGGDQVTLIERNSLSTSRGLCVVEERDMVMLSEARADAAPKTSPTIPSEAKWHQTIEPNPPLLFRFSAIRFNSHRIHYDRDYVTKVEKTAGAGCAKLADLPAADGNVPKRTAGQAHDQLRLPKPALGLRQRRQVHPARQSECGRTGSYFMGGRWQRQSGNGGNRKIRLATISPRRHEEHEVPSYYYPQASCLHGASSLPIYFASIG